MPENKSQPSHIIPIWGVFLLFLGIVFLLQNAGILPWGLWSVLWRFWPVVIIAAGLGMLLRHRNPWLVSGLILVLFLICLGIASLQYSQSPTSQTTTRSYTAPIGSLTTARVEIDFSAGRLKLGSLGAGSPNLVEATSESGDGSSIIAKLQPQGNEGTLKLTTDTVNRQFWNETKWEVNLNRKIPLIMDIKSNVGDLNLNLSELAVNELQMDLNAGSCVMTMPSPIEKTTASITANVSNLEVTIPEGVAARIKASGNLSNLSVNTIRFPKKGDYYVSDGFSSSGKRLEIELNCNIGKVEVK